METIYRPKRFSQLTEDQKKLKLAKDAEYKLDSDNRSAEFYTKKRTVGVTAEEETAFNELDKQKWEEYQIWAISAGLYEEVTPEQQLSEAEEVLNAQVEQVNLIRSELGLKQVEVTEKAVEVR